MKLQRIFRTIAVILLILCFASTSMGASGTELAGEWVYEYSPEVTVLTLREDGSAFYAGTDLTWQITDGAITLTDADNASFNLPYELTDDIMTVWLPAQFSRISEIGADGKILGTWKALGGSGSSFVFTEEKQFLEDGAFTGTYVDDPETGRVTLQYAQGMFEDTMILYSFDGDILVIAYPWKLIRK